MITYRTDEMSILRRFFTIRNPPSAECLNILFVSFIDDIMMMRGTQAIVCYVRGYYLEPKYNLELSRDISASFLSIIWETWLAGWSSSQFRSDKSNPHCLTQWDLKYLICFNSFVLCTRSAVEQSLPDDIKINGETFLMEDLNCASVTIETITKNIGN